MTLETGVVTGSEIKKNRDGEFSARLLQCIVTDPEDVQTVQLMNHVGEDSAPPIGSTVLIGTVGDVKFAIASEDNITPEVAPGEKLLYSSSGGTEETPGTKQATLNLRVDGSIEINGLADFAMRFNSFKAVFDAFLVSLNTELTQIGVLLPGYANTLLPADMTPARVDTVKLP